MARWLAARFPREAEVAWAALTDADRLDETLSLLATTAEGDAFSEGGMGWRQWIRVAKGGRRLSDLQLIVEVFERARLPAETRDWLFESLAFRFSGAPGPPGARERSRAPPRTPPSSTMEPLERSDVDLVQALERPLPLTPAPRPLAEAMIEAARVAMATRQRELHAFSYPNADDVLTVDAGRGFRLAFIGIEPDFRLPLEGYYGFLALKNGVPVSYGGGWELFGTLDFAINIFPSFRQGESPYLATQLLRAYRGIFGMRTVVIDRYQLGHESAEALRSGSFYFYHRLGFRPRDPAVVQTPRPRAGEDRRRPRVSLADPDLEAARRGRGVPDAPGRSEGARAPSPGDATFRRWSRATSLAGSTATAPGPRATRPSASRVRSAPDGAGRGRLVSGARSSACRSWLRSSRIFRRGRSPSGARSWPSCGAREAGARWPMRAGSTDTAACAEPSQHSLAHSAPHHCLAVLALTRKFSLDRYFQ